MRNKLKHGSFFGLIGLGVILSAALFSIINSDKSFSVTSDQNTCSGAVTYGAQAAGTTTIALPLLAEFKISAIAPTSSISQINIFANDSTTATDTLIGHAIPSTTNVVGTSVWNFVWPTSLWKRAGSANGTVSVYAKITFNNGLTPCLVSSSNQYYVPYSSTPSTLNVTTTPQNITTYVGESNTQEVVAMTTTLPAALVSADLINKYGIYNWFTENNNIGGLSISNSNFISGSNIIFNAGKTAGSNIVKVNYTYGGSTSNTAQIPVTLKPLETATTTTTNPNPNTATTNTVTTTTPVTTSELATTNQVSSSLLEVSSVAQSCIESGLSGTDRYAAIAAGQATATTNELTKTATCFATSKYILPTVFSPVNPLKVEDLATEETTTVANMENVNKTVGTTTKEALKITGKSVPKSTIFVYIFSDPIVIITTADDNGNWQYTLEDPLVPGKHEVYAVVDKGDGTYKRSDPMSFFISTASASASNPNSLSLKLSKAPVKTPTALKGNLFYYIAGSVAVLIFALLSMLLAMRLHKHKKALIAINDTSCPNCNTPMNEILNGQAKPVEAMPKFETVAEIAPIIQTPTEPTTTAEVPTIQTSVEPTTPAELPTAIIPAIDNSVAAPITKITVTDSSIEPQTIADQNIINNQPQPSETSEPQ